MTDEQDKPAKPVESRADLYRRLTAPFDVVHKRPDGLDYITGEQCITRLNEVLGFLGWTFRVMEHGIHAEADEVWVQGELLIQTSRETAIRQQFGSQKVKRSRASGTPLDIGFDLKGAATDALKKCAMSIGVGLYLSEKDVPGNAHRGDDSGPRAIRSSVAGGSSTAAPESDAGVYVCQECGEALTETSFRDGKTWSPSDLAGFGRRKFGRVLDMACYRKANAAKKAAEEAAF